MFPIGDKIDDAFDRLIQIIDTTNRVLTGLPENAEAKKATAGAVILRLSCP